MPEQKPKRKRGRPIGRDFPKPITVNVSTALLKRIDKTADGFAYSRGLVVRECLERYLDKWAQAERQRIKRSR